MREASRILTCTCLENWWTGDPCPTCQAITLDLLKQFDQDVLAGKYDREGYTPAERRAFYKKYPGGKVDWP